MTTPTGEQVISSGWCAGRITNALKDREETCLEALDPFAAIDLVSKPSVEQDDSNMLQIKESLIQHLLSDEQMNPCDSDGVGAWRCKCFWCHSSGTVICKFYWLSTEFFPK